MRLSPLKVLQEEEIELIHKASINQLESKGLIVESKELRSFLSEKGAVVDEDSRVVLFPRDIIEKSIDYVPKKFALFGPDGVHRVDIDGENIQFATIGTPKKILDENRRLPRNSVFEDYKNQIRLVDALPNLSCSHVDVWPTDIPANAIHAHAILEWAKLSHKPLGFECLGKVVTQDVIDMLKIIVGSESELMRRPRVVGFFNVQKHGRIPHLMTNGLSVLTRYRQPVIISSSMIGSSAGPVSIAAGITQVNAEVLAIITIAQLMAPGTPILYGPIPSLFEPTNETIARPSTEIGLCTTALTQMGHHYGVPTRGLGCISASKLVDLQCGIERFMTLFYAAMAGTNYITCAGTYESNLTESFELLAVDDDLAGKVSELLEGIPVTPYTVNTESLGDSAGEEPRAPPLKMAIKGPDSSMLGNIILDRNSRNVWTDLNSLDTVQRAREKVKALLKNHKGPGLPAEVQKSLEEIVQCVESRTTEQILQIEGVYDSLIRK